MNNDLVSREALRKRMYHEVFDNGMGKWESGLWIRYKLFEKVIKETPAVDFVEVVRCKDCVHWDSEVDPPQYEGSNYCFMADWRTEAKGFCSFGERKDNE